MRNVFAFFYRVRAELLLVSLMALCMNVLYQNSSFQKAVFAKNTSGVTGAIIGVRASIDQYFGLVAENKRLNARIETLEAQQHKSFSHIPSTLFEKRDTLFQQTYFYTAGQIINSSTQKPRNTLTINRGSIHGVRVGNGIIAPQGIVGMVTEVSEHYALAIPVINTQFTCSAEILGKGFFGLLGWNGQDAQQAVLYDMADYINVIEGDAVITRGASTIFPRGIPIGTVANVNRDRNTGQTELTVDLAVDFSTLRHIQIVQHVYQDELNALTQP